MNVTGIRNNGMRIFKFLTLILAVSWLVAGCSGMKETKEPLKIALSKGSGSPSYEMYAKWLKSIDPDIECIDLYTSTNPIGDLMSCSGLILTGGPDVEPFRYGKAEDSSRCDIDLVRDDLEFSIIPIAMDINMPVLAICRGEQILNVNFGGTLIVDIPQDYKTDISHKCQDASNCFHDVDIVPGTLLDSLCGSPSGVVNSNHHQSVDELSYLFKVAARSKDGIIEAIEWAEPEGKSFLIAVQWHPERLPEDSPYSKPLATAFIEKSREFRKIMDNMIKQIRQQADEEEKEAGRK